MTHFILGIDNGGSVSKAALYSTDGKLVAQASDAVPPAVSNPGWSERDMNKLWQANINAISKVVRESGAKPDEIDGITVTGHGNGLYLVDDAGNPVRNGIVSNDSRAKDIQTRWKKDGSYRKYCRDRVTVPVLSGGPLLLMHWMWKNEPESVRKTKYVLFIKDYIRFRLTGRPTLELTDTSTTDLLDMETRTINVQSFAPMDIGPWEDKFPPIIEPNDVGGRVTAEVAAQTGLAVGTPVFGGTADMDASAIGAGVVKDNQLSMVTGTWSINEYFATSPLVGDPVETGTVVSFAPIPGRYLIEDGSPTSAANLEWFIRNILQKIPGTLSASRDDLYKLCGNWAFAYGATSEKVKYLPFVYGSGLHPECPAGWTGLTNVDGLPQMLRALFEGVVFATREHAERLASYTTLTGPARLTGGVANNRKWVQLYADILGRTIETVDVKEAGILGAVMVALVGLGHFPDLASAADVMVPTPRVFEPNAAAKEEYDNKYHDWLTECTARISSSAPQKELVTAV